MITGTRFIMTYKTLNPILLKMHICHYQINNVIKKYLDYKFSNDQNQLKGKSDVHCFKLPYISNLSYHIKNKLSELYKENFKKRKFWHSFKIKNYFSYKHPIPVVPAILAKNCCHFKTRIEEHMKMDNKSHIFKHLHSTTTCFDWYNSLCFKTIDKVNSKFDLKIK